MVRWLGIEIQNTQVLRPFRHHIPERSGCLSGSMSTLRRLTCSMSALVTYSPRNLTAFLVGLLLNGH